MSKQITRSELIKKFIEFFKSKNHKEIPNSSLVPQNDPTVLFTTAGMHPLVPFLLGQSHSLGKRLVNVQRCIRTGDIDEVGDAFHHTFFEMLGNWSLGDYFKKEAIDYSFEFLIKELKIPIEKLSVSCFEGDKDSAKDEESSEAWKKLGIPKEKIVFLPKKNNWWGPAGNTGPCGPDTEMFFYIGKNKNPKTNPKTNEAEWCEIWNDVFMEYNKVKTTLLVDGMGCLYDQDFKINTELLNFLISADSRRILVVNGNEEKARELLKKYNIEIFSLEKDKIKKDNPEFFKRLMQKLNLKEEELVYFDHAQENLEGAKKAGINLIRLYKNNENIFRFIEENQTPYIQAKQKNVDTGMGVERTLAILNGFDDNYRTEIWQPIIKEIEKISKKSYETNKKEMRIIADHIKAATFAISDNVVPSNIERGYVVRRLIRRAVRYGKQLGINITFTAKLAEKIIELYEESYSALKNKKNEILTELDREERKFLETLEKGIKEFEKIAKQIIDNKQKIISGKPAFLLYQSYGFPIELSQELAKEKNLQINMIEFEEESAKHQKLSQTASAGQFKSGLADNSEQTTKYHTATHLLLSALRQVLGEHVEQRGSNITAERLRFDFNHKEKLTPEQIKEIEKIVNENINKKLDVKREEMPVKEAKAKGAMGIFDEKYGNNVSVYTICNPKDIISKEICTGPHVTNTSQLGKFKIIKEESSASGIRRIKAVLE